jgi:hypothetical protein
LSRTPTATQTCPILLPGSTNKVLGTNSKASRTFECTALSAAQMKAKEMCVQLSNTQLWSLVELSRDPSLG